MSEDVEERLKRLSREHREMQKALAKVQDTTAFYQSHFQKADQVLKAVKKGQVDTPRFKPDFLKDKQYIETIRELVKRAVYSKWSTDKTPSTLVDIYRFVKGEIKKMMSMGTWDTKAWRFPSKRTVDRRTNETADSRFWKGPTPLIAIKAGIYIPNPVFFDEETKKQLLKLRNLRQH